MKNYLSEEFFDLTKQLLRKMRITCLLVIVFASTLFATNVNSQVAKVNITLKNAPLIQVLRTIENQTDYLFVYDKNEIDLTQQVNIIAKNQSVTEVLTRLFSDASVEYGMVGSNIVLMPAKSVLQQAQAIFGRVSDSSGEPLPGVTVIIKGTTQGTITDFDGNYTISNVPAGGTLVFSFVGMRSEEIVVGNQSGIDVTMTVDAIGLEEVVAVGYGTMKKVNLTGAVSSVKSDELAKSPAASTVNTLAGRLPGLVVKQTSGQPGFDESRINIRNFGNALIIVDGTEQSFNNIDPNEIESISILKDASAAIYGSRAGNGVILVTTKRGTIGKPKITLNSTMTGQAYTNFPEPVNAGQYATLYREAQINSGVPEGQLRYSESDIAKYFDGSDPQFPNTDWQDIIMRDWAPQQQHNLSVNGGNESVKYYTFLSFLDQEGMFKGGNTGYKRYNVRSNIDASITSQFSISLDLSAIKENARQSNRPATDVWFWMDFFDSRPTSHASFPDKTKVPSISPGPFNAIINTHEDIGGYNKLFKTTLNGALNLKYDVKAVKGLSVGMKMNYYQLMVENKAFTKQVDFWNYDFTADTYTKAGQSLPTNLSQSYSSNQVITGQARIEYANTFYNKHNVSALFLYEAIDYSNNYFSAYRQNYITSSIDQLFAGGTVDQMANGSAFESGRQSLVGRLSYNYSGKYLAEATFRYDGSPNFPKDKRWGFFPSLSAGWRLSEESFIKDNLSWIDNLKLRGGISHTGYDGVPAYQYLAGYRFQGIFVSDGNEVPGLATTGLPNTNITWETMTLSNIGVDLSIFNGRLYTEMDIFERIREDMLGSRIASLPTTFGASLPNENINSQRSRGFEFLLGTKGQIGEFKYDVSANVSYSRAKWKYFDEIEYTDPDQIRIFKRTGQWTDVQFGYVSDGLFTSQSEIDNLTYDIDGVGNTSLRPGDIKYVDLNDDGRIDFRDWDEIGSGGTPHIMFGFNTNLTYKGFDFSMLVQGAGDYNINLQSSNINIDSERTPYKVIWEERWTPENNDKDAIIPRQKFSQTTNNWNSDYYNRDAKYVRLKNVSLGYTFKSSLVNRIGLDQLRVFATGTNLLTFSQITQYGLDPESPDATRGWTYPIQKTVSLGVNLNF